MLVFFTLDIACISLIASLNCFWEATMLFLNIILLNFVFMSMFNVSYGALVFEERYLITTFFMAVLLVGLFFG